MTANNIRQRAMKRATKRCGMYRPMECSPTNSLLLCIQRQAAVATLAGPTNLAARPLAVPKDTLGE